MEYNLSTLEDNQVLSNNELEYYKKDFRNFLMEGETRDFLKKEIENCIKNEIMKKLYDLYTERLIQSKSHIIKILKDNISHSDGLNNIQEEKVFKKTKMIT